MRRALLGACLVLAACGRVPQYRVVRLPEGTMDIREPLVVDAHTEVRGSPRGSAIRMADGFIGRAAILIRGDGVLLHDFAIFGNRERLEVRSGLPPYDQPFATFTKNSGILADSRTSVAIDNLQFHDMAGFAILISRGPQYLHRARHG